MRGLSQAIFELSAAGLARSPARLFANKTISKKTAKQV